LEETVGFSLHSFIGENTVIAVLEDKKRAEYYSVMRANAPRTERRFQILIADDHPIIRKRVRAILEGRPDFEVCAEVEDGAKAIEAAQRLKPDVVVLNISMPILDGFAAARVIKAKVPESAIVILSSEADKHFVEEAKKIGVRAYVAKYKASEALVKAIERAIDGGDDFVLMN
jgi:DNA-binding NarL/FixJ family response regulator